MKHLLKSIYKKIPLKKHLFLVLRSFYRPPQSVYQYFIFWDKFKVIVENNSFWIKHHGLYIENEIFWGGLTEGKFEKLSMQLWIKLCKEATCVIDIGANTGVYSLVTKALNPDARVIAFEPIHRTFEKLLLNNSINQYDIVCERIALSDKDGEGYIFDPETVHNNLATLNADVADKNRIGRKIPISLQKLSTYIREKKIGRIDLMKIDVEGHEPNVLSGMEDYLDQMRPTMLIEINSDEMGSQIEEILDGKGYLYFNIDEKSRIELLPHLIKSYHNNYLICNKEVAKKLQLIE
ncbi:FkbM family methyltransferase [Rhodocytophaga rosea]|uniref:FkbM family methyltransferase n=1 Tax=Rhodocytophaga rosea TaxID=2704465 RepID=A0A6C0GSQ0_9BACT|nr:FkbM family methyltransferase [Rhodocytophaga rosea]QHT70490.1 FkbM family methyltransferase [Rhodocytophaga rosea]